MPWRCREIRLTTVPVDPSGDERLSHVLNASERLVMAESVDEVVAVLRDVARTTVGADGVAVVIQHEGRCAYIAEDAVSPLWQGQTFPADHCVSGWVMRRGETIAIRDVRLDPRIPQDAYAPTFVRSLVMAPIGRPVPVAALGAYWSQVRSHDDDTVKRLESLARLATIAIENARLTQARNRAAALGAAQNRILELAVEDTPLNVALDAIVREVEALSPSRFLGSILLLNEEGSQLQHCAGPGLPLPFINAVEHINVGVDAGAGSTMTTLNASASVCDIENDPHWAGLRALAVEHGLHVCGSIPIRSAQGAMLGTFVMYHAERREPLPADIEIGDFVVKTVGLVVHRARAEAAIRSSEARYRQIVEGAEDFAIITFDARGRVTGWNIGAQRIVGYRAEEAMGREGDLFYTDSDQANHVFQGELLLAMEQGRAVNERWHVDKSGARFWGSGLMMPLATDQGGFVKIFRDRTADHQAEAALQESAEQLSFFDELDSRLFTIRRAEDAMLAATELLGRKLDVSRCVYADVDVDHDRFWIRSGYNASGIQSPVGTYSLDLFGPRAAADMREGRTLIVRDVVAELGPSEGLEMFRGIGIDAIICCPLVKNGRLTAMMAVHQNAPRDWLSAEVLLVREVVERCWAHVERVGAEMRMRESEERLRLAVEHADIGFWDVDIVHDTLIWPPRTKAMFGIQADAPVTIQDFYDGLHPEDRDATIEAFTAAIDSQRRALYDVDYRTVGRDDGVIRWVAAKGRGVFDGAGRCLRVTGTVVEITARKDVEEELRELNATLEGRIAKAIAEREEVQEALRQSQKMEAMGQLTGGVAHDFNNLLTPIVGTLDMLQRRGVGGEREQRLISGAVQSADRARTLVQRLLAFARRQPLQPVSVDVAKLVNGMGDLVASTTGPQIRVVVDAPPDLPAAIADPNQLEMALLNLSVNARDAMLEGGTMRISASAEWVCNGHRSRLPTGDYLCLSVADTGTGMDASTLARAVEPFFSTKGVGKGTGLGLSMVHGLASQLNGALTIQSSPGLGTNVELWLPRSMSLPAAALRTEEAPERRSLRGIALLVDDEELVRASTSYMLADLGYRVIEASSGEEALQLLGTGQHVDLIVTDHLMPGISGTDLARRVRISRPGTAILLVSGYAEHEGLDPDLPRLTKPFRKSELAASLAQLEGAS
ncbi:PAS domain S-box-containing protein [Pseudomonas graminis]|nr:PAS domain S-box-containing protein [Pseudomonas graminis]